MTIVGRKSKKRTVFTLEAIPYFPCFIKPATEIKAFTEIIVNNHKEAKLYTNDFNGVLSVQEIINFESEYRVYVHKDRGILGIKHYLGDPYIVSDKNFVEAVYNSDRKTKKTVTL